MATHEPESAKPAAGMLADPGRGTGGSSGTFGLVTSFSFCLRGCSLPSSWKNRTHLTERFPVETKGIWVSGSR